MVTGTRLGFGTDEGVTSGVSEVGCFEVFSCDEGSSELGAGVNNELGSGAEDGAEDGRGENVLGGSVGSGGCVLGAGSSVEDGESGVSELLGGSGVVVGGGGVVVDDGSGVLVEGSVVVSGVVIASQCPEDQLAIICSFSFHLTSATSSISLEIPTIIYASRIRGIQNTLGKLRNVIAKGCAYASVASQSSIEIWG